MTSLCEVVAFLYFGAKHVEQWTPATGGQASASCPRGLLTGEVMYVRDGDTIEVAGVPIRLNGLAAPESDDPGGRAATAAMRRLVDGHQVRCELNGERTYDRCVGVCYLNGEDIATKLVLEGVARDCPRYSDGRYAEAERRAGGGRGRDDPEHVPLAQLLSLKSQRRTRITFGPSHLKQLGRPCSSPSALGSTSGPSSNSAAARTGAFTMAEARARRYPRRRGRASGVSAPPLECQVCVIPALFSGADKADLLVQLSCIVVITYGWNKPMLNMLLRVTAVGLFTSCTSLSQPPGTEQQPSKMAMQSELPSSAGLPAPPGPPPQPPLGAIEPAAGPSSGPPLSLDQCRRLAARFFDLPRDSQKRRASELRQCIGAVTAH